MKTEQPRPIPLFLDGKYVGQIKGHELIIYRKPTQIYMNVPCPKHKRCPGLTVAKNIVDLANQFCTIITFVVGDTKYVMNLQDFIYHSTVMKDDKGREELGMPLHEFVKVEG